MIESRTHAALDWTMCGALLASALLPGRRGRGLSAGAAVALAGLSCATDYEGGAVPRLSLGTHRAVEAGIGAALLAGGPRVLGLALLGLAAGAGPVAAHGPPDPGYRPLGALKPFAPDVWTADAVINGIVPVRMTAIRLPDGALWLHSPIAYSASLRAELEAIGPIRHLVAPSITHWMFVKGWQDAVPDAVTWAAPRLRERGQVQRSGLRIDHVLGDAAPPSWGGAIEPVLIRGHGPFRELAFLHAPSRTAMLTDLVQNFEAEKLPWAFRPVARLMGNVGPVGRAPAYLRALVGRRDAAAARRIVAWAPERLVVAHGALVEHDAASVLRESLLWLTG